MNERRIYLLGAALLCIAVVFSTGYHHFDEHFQIVEFAATKLGINTEANLPWEYDFQMRPAFQPALAVVLYKICFSTDPFVVATVFRLISAVLAFIAMWLMYRTFRKTISDPVLSKWFLLLSFLMWFMVYNGVRFSSENWSGCLFIIAFALYFNRSDHKTNYLFGLGLLMGLSFLCRFQSALLIAGWLAWITFLEKKWNRAFMMGMGVLLVASLGVVIDRWFYGEWTFTAWNYIDQNLIQGKVSSFGVDPWWKYFYEIFLMALPPIGLVVILSFILMFIFRLKDPMVWAIIPFLLVHLLIGHKEARFLFPLMGYVPIVLIRTIELLNGKQSGQFTIRPWLKWSAVFFWGVNLLALVVVIFKPADSQISLYKKLYDQYPEKSVLYYSGANPYHRVEDVYFYKRPGLQILEIDSLQQISGTSDQPLLFVSKKRLIDAPPGLNMELIYSSFPDWVLKYNYNHWIERTNCWYVYELK